MRRANAVLGAMVLVGCGRDRPAICDEAVNPSWEPKIEWETRLDEAGAAWTAEGEGTIDAAATEGCATAAPCLSATGPVTASTSLLLNRDVPHAVSASVTTDAGARLVVQHERENGNVEDLASVWVPPGGPTRVDLPFEGGGGGGEAWVALVVDEGSATLDDLEVTAETWAYGDPDAEPAGTLQLGFLIHVEQDVNFPENEDTWRVRARVIEGLAQTLWAHGAKLGFQPDATFTRGAAVWEPEWYGDRALEGVGLSVHIHAEAGTAEEVDRAVREGRDAFADLGLDVTDLNGGYGSGPWAEMAAAGIVSLSAYKDPATAAGLPLAYTQPWRPADGAASLDAFPVHDPDGPLVYLPGAPRREDDHARVGGFVDRVLSQVLGHTRPDVVNTWYFVLHVDRFGPGPGDAEEAEAYFDGGAFDADLAHWDAMLTDVVDPLVAARTVKYATPSEMADSWLDWESACR